MNAIFRAAGPIALSALLIAAAGCGPGGNRVSGTLMNNGAPIAVSNKGLIQLSFVPADDKSGSVVFPSILDEKTGTFEIKGRGDGNNVPNGKYRVVVEVLDPYPGNDKFKGKYNKENSKIVKEVSGNSSIDIDLAKDGG